MRRPGVPEARLGVDVGGTFTDLVVLDGERVLTAKVPSTPRDRSVGVMHSLEVAEVAASSITSFSHGTTVATNALLERSGARTALVTTEGFRDLIEIGRQDRPSLYDPTVRRPAPLVPRERRLTVPERMGPEGVIRPLDPHGVADAIAELRRDPPDAVAVCLLFGFLHPEHERRVAEEVRRALPGVPVSVSSVVLPEFREYERTSTTVANAYLAPVLDSYLATLEDAAKEADLPVPLVMRSSGGVVSIDDARDRAAACVLSGPAAGAIGAAHVAASSGFREVLSFDMGGTSTDVAMILDGTVATTTGAVVAGVPIRLPMVDVHSVSAGGGSIAWIDTGGALRVGPRSAGASPGPAAYGAGGVDATVTDANLLLGYLGDGAVFGGEVTLRRGLAEEAMRSLARELDGDPTRVAEGVIQVADAEMVRALRVVTVERGLDPRGYAVAAFGGAGPTHACALAEELGIAKILVPRAGGVLSALGLAIADLRRDDVSPFRADLGSVDEQAMDDAFGAMRRRAEADLGPADVRELVDMRYRGQSFELTVEKGRGVADLVDSFHQAHERRYGYRMDDQPIEIVNLRLVATVPRTVPTMVEPPARGDPLVGARRAWFDGAWVEVPVLDRTRLGEGSQVAGPAVIEFPETTCVLRPRWDGVVDAAGNLVLEVRVA